MHEQKSAFTAVIDVSGRQRMRAQGVPKELLLVVKGLDEGDPQKNLQGTIDLFDFSSLSKALRGKATRRIARAPSIPSTPPRCQGYRCGRPPEESPEHHQPLRVALIVKDIEAEGHRKTYVPNSLPILPIPQEVGY